MRIFRFKAFVLFSIVFLALSGWSVENGGEENSSEQKWNIKDLDATQIKLEDVKLLDSYSKFPRWSPDGSKILYTKHDSQIWMVNPDGSNKERIIDGYDATWSPDGKRIAYKKERKRIAVYDLEKKEEYIILYEREVPFAFKDMFEWHGYHPQWSKDGTKIFFTPSGSIRIPAINLDNLKLEIHDYYRTYAVSYPNFKIRSGEGGGIWATNKMYPPFTIRLLDERYTFPELSPDLTRLVFVLEDGGWLGSSAVYVAKIGRSPTSHVSYYEIPMGLKDGIKKEDELGVFEPKINPLNNKLIGYNERRKKGEVLVESVAENKALVRTYLLREDFGQNPVAVDKRNESFGYLKDSIPRAELSIHKAGTTYVSGYQARIENLELMLERILSMARDKKLYLKVNHALEWGNFVDIVEIIKATGIEEIIITELLPFEVLEKTLEVRIPEITTDILAVPSGELVAPIEIPEDILGPIVLTLHRDGKVDLNRRFYEFNRVQKELACIYSARLDKTIFVRADAIISFGKVIELIDLAKEAGAKTIGIIQEYFKESWEDLEKETEAVEYEEETNEAWEPVPLDELQRATMKDITIISTALADYLTDNGVVPEQEGIYSGASDFYSSLSPFYVKILPIKDPLGNNYRVYCGKACNGVYGISGCGSDDFIVVSYGRDGQEDDWKFDSSGPEAGLYVRSIDNLDNDIVMWSGSWIRGPRTATVAREKDTEKEVEAIKHEEEAREVWVMPRIIGELKESLYIGKKEVFPPKVEIKGPASKIKNICLVETTPIDISSWTKYGEVEADIILHDPHIELSPTQAKVKVKITIVNAKAEATAPVRVIGEIQPPKLLKEVSLVYPEIAKQARVEGVVILEVTIDVNGKADNVKVLRSIPLLDQAAIDCVRQWVYEPTIIDGKRRRVIHTVTIMFKLPDKKKQTPINELLDREKEKQTNLKKDKGGEWKPETLKPWLPEKRASN